MSPRLLLLGYLRLDLLATDEEVVELEREMAGFARLNDFVMGRVHLEERGGWPAAFEALLESVARPEVSAVLLPSLLHFAMSDSPVRIRRVFEQTTGTRVLLLTPLADQRRWAEPHAFDEAR